MNERYAKSEALRSRMTKKYKQQKETLCLCVFVANKKNEFKSNT